MRDTLPKTPLKNESAIVNLDSQIGSGTHWVAYTKRHKNVWYFDSFGNLPPPKELVNYFGHNINIKYNYKRFQKLNSYNCGHLCLKFLIYTQNNQNIH